MRSYSTRAPEELASEKGSGRQERAERGCNKRPCFGDNISPPLLLPTRVFRPVFPGRVFVSLPVSLPLVSVILVRILRQAFLSFLLAFNLLHPLSISDTTFFLRLSAFSSHSSFSRATLVSPFLPPILALPPCAYTRRPKLESNFPHHIPQKLLRGCSAGQEATRDARLSHEGTTEHFYLLFASLLPLSCLPPFPPFPRAVRSKTISEHIARVRLRSLPSNPGAFPAPSPCAPRARRYVVPLIRPSWKT